MKTSDRKQVLRRSLDGLAEVRDDNTKPQATREAARRKYNELYREWAQLERERS